MISGFPKGRERLTELDLAPVITAHLEGDSAAGELLAGVLSHHALLTTRSFLGRDRPETDDIAQDTVMAVLAFLKRRRGFQGDIVSFTVTIARNRCRNLLIWRQRHPGAPIETVVASLADPGFSPLDSLLENEVNALLQEALDRLGEACRSLLRELYIEGRRVEEVRRRLGLRTVQGIYYRRAGCLKRAAKLLKKRLADCSSGRGGAS
jgi:RNA polymerase sigma factor (sigma-70 family)